jgi:hypothetical protein
MTFKRLRIVCISDTHNQTPKLPSGDILIHAGDLTNQGTFSELQKTVNWIKQSPYRVKIVIAGNHDITCDHEFYEQYGGYFHNKKREDSLKCTDLFALDPSIVYLNHESKTIEFSHADGSSSKLNVFGSPYSPAHGFWAFGYSPEAASQLWDQIPLYSDIVVTHTPPKYHRDECSKRGTAGCEALRQTLWRVRPRLVVCGHIHEAHGVEVVEWDLTDRNVKYKEVSTRCYPDTEPQSKKQYTIDLSSRSRSSALNNDGACGNLPQPTCLLRVQNAASDGLVDADIAPEDGIMDQESAKYERQKDPVLPVPRLRKPPPPAEPFPDHEKAERPASRTTFPTNSQHLGTRGHGGPASSAHSDHDAISGREGRSETCVVNAAFMSNNYPHVGGKRFHKPVVIELDFPVVW